MAVDVHVAVTGCTNYLTVIEGAVVPTRNGRVKCLLSKQARTHGEAKLHAHTKRLIYCQIIDNVTQRSESQE